MMPGAAKRKKYWGELKGSEGETSIRVVLGGRFLAKALIGF